MAPLGEGPSASVDPTMCESNLNGREAGRPAIKKCMRFFDLVPSHNRRHVISDGTIAQSSFAKRFFRKLGNAGAVLLLRNGEQQIRRSLPPSEGIYGYKG